jgi:hypothetical protein
MWIAKYQTICGNMQRILKKLNPAKETRKQLSKILRVLPQKHGSCGRKMKAD